MADALVDPADPARWTHAVMDLGATICRPAAPRCDACPLSAGAPARRRLTASSDRRRCPSRRRAAARRAPDPAFPTTRRWLRGRIVASLRDLPDGAWRAVRGPIGEHDAAAVEAAIADLAGEGMLELRPDGAVRLPSTRR